MRESAMVQLHDVIYRWPEANAAVGPLSVSLPAGQLVGVIGPNGAGKSTLLKLLAGFLRPHQGQVVVGGKDISTLNGQSRARLVAFVPQTLETTFDLTVEEVVQLGSLHRYTWRDRLAVRPAVDQDRLAAVLESTGLTPLRQRPFPKLSGGEAKRVLLAAALLQDTPVLLLDEPTAHLDPGHAVGFLHLLQELVAREEKTVIMAYHDLASVGLFAHRLWVMHRGRLVAQGDAQSILSSPIIADVYQVSLVYLAHPQNHKPLLIFP
ncbi:MAG: ABC transporter ATP-binding protein [Firmicutes bacterium]|nr:ABC transporter ATP-binding protein [Bacillota bacterium]